MKIKITKETVGQLPAHLHPTATRLLNEHPDAEIMHDPLTDAFTTRYNPAAPEEEPEDETDDEGEDEE